MKSDISVIIPLYNHCNYIADAIDSVLCQTIAPKEIIIVDDGSKDSSFKLVKTRFRNEKKIILWSKPNQGAHHAINCGIHRATSPYIAILNSDDIYYPSRLETCLSILEKDIEAQIVCTGVQSINACNTPITNHWYSEALNFYKTSQDLTLSLINGNFLMTTSNFVVRRSIFEKIGYFRNFRYAHDLDFLLRLLIQGFKICTEPQDLLKYRVHSRNTINEGALKVKVEVASIIAEYLTQAMQLDSKFLSHNYLAHFYSVLDTHNLSRMLFPFMAIMSSNQSMTADKIINDQRLLTILLTIAK